MADPIDRVAVSMLLLCGVLILGCLLHLARIGLRNLQARLDERAEQLAAPIDWTPDWNAQPMPDRVAELTEDELRQEVQVLSAALSEERINRKLNHHAFLMEHGRANKADSLRARYLRRIRRMERAS